MATPLESSVAEPMVVEPALNVIVPVGGGPELLSTDATRTTCGLVPAVDVMPRSVFVGIRFTVSLTGAEVLGESAASPA